MTFTDAPVQSERRQAQQAVLAARAEIQRLEVERRTVSINQYATISEKIQWWKEEEQRRVMYLGDLIMRGYRE